MVLNMKYNSKGQGSLEMLIIFGVLVIGAIIFSLIYVGNLKNASEKNNLSETNNNLISNFNSGLNEYDNPNKKCNENGVCEPQKGETPQNCLDCFIAIPVATALSGAYLLGTEISLSTTTPQANIYYTIDGSQPSQESTQYTSSIVLNNSIILKAIACKENVGCSAVSDSYQYTVSSLNLTIFPESGNYNYAQKQITMSSSETGVEIRYTLNGSEPTAQSTLYSGPISLTEPYVVKAKAFKDRYLPSSTVTKDYKIILPVPIATPESKTYTSYVALSSAISGAIIKYTTDGSDPNYGITYSFPFFDGDFYLRAITIHADSGYITSSETNKNYIFKNDNSALFLFPENVIPGKPFSIKYITKNKLIKPVFYLSSKTGDCEFTKKATSNYVDDLFEYLFVNNKCSFIEEARAILEVEDVGSQPLGGGAYFKDVVFKDFNITYDTIEFYPIEAPPKTKFRMSFYINIEEFASVFGSSDGLEKLVFKFNEIEGCTFSKKPEIEKEGDLIKYNFQNNVCESVGEKKIVLEVFNNEKLYKKINASYTILSNKIESV